MPRVSRISLRLFALVLGVGVLSTCGPDTAGIRRLPLEPEAAPGKLTVSPSGAVLSYIGATERLSATVVPEGSAAGLSFSWFSTNTGVATVASDGTIRAIAEGQAKIIVRIMNLVDTADVTVKRLPETVTLVPDTMLFTDLASSQSVTATLVDGGGQSLPVSQIAWSSSDTSVVRVSASGVITSVGQGLTTVKATAGAVVATVRVHVAVGPSDVTVTPSSVRLTAIGATQQLNAVVSNAAGASMPEVDVTYKSDNPGVATVSANGLVRSVALGTTSILVSGDTAFATVQVAVQQEPASVVVTPDGVKAAPGATVSYAAAVSDLFDNPIPNPVLTWTTTDAAVAIITSQGRATAVSEGSVGIVALAGNVADTVQLLVVEPIADSVAVDIDSLTLVINERAFLTAVLFDAESDEIVGAQPTWSSDDDAVALVDDQGMVTGVGGGSTWIRAQSGTGADSTHVEVEAGASDFDIEVRYVGPEPNAETQAAFAVAEARWEEIILGDLADIPVTLDAGACSLAHPAVSETVDDLLIYAEITSIDGEGGVLGQAGPCLTRNVGGLAILGIMQFDVADVSMLATEGLLNATIIHEMGHVLGFGVGDPWENTLVDKGSNDPYWPGAQAVTQYGANGGTEVKAVPVANTGGAGTRDAHWREAHMGRELMTGFINLGQNPLSSISVGAMQDMGYTVDILAGDPYTVSAALRSGPSRMFELNDVVLTPIMVIDVSGQIRVIGRR